jgi:hypothetical protein
MLGRETVSEGKGRQMVGRYARNDRSKCTDTAHSCAHSCAHRIRGCVVRGPRNDLFVRMSASLSYKRVTKEGEYHGPCNTTTRDYQMACCVPRFRVLRRDRDDVPNDDDGNGGDQGDGAHSDFVGEVRVKADPDCAGEEGRDSPELDFDST